MRGRDLASLAFAVAGVYVLAKSLEILPALLTIPGYDLDEGLYRRPNLIVLGYLISIAITVALGLTLIVKRRSFAAAVLSSDADVTVGMPAREVHIVLTSVAGVFLVGLAMRDLPEVIHGMAVLAHEYGIPGAEERRNDYFQHSWLWLAGVLLQLAFGGLLIGWSRRLVDLLRHRKPPSATEDARCPHCGHSYSPADYRTDAAHVYCSKCKNELPDAPRRADV